MTAAQQMSRILLETFYQTARKEPFQLEISDEYKRLHAVLDSLTYNVCLAWASEQHQLAMEAGNYVPFELDTL